VLDGGPDLPTAKRSEELEKILIIVDSLHILKVAEARLEILCAYRRLGA